MRLCSIASLSAVETRTNTLVFYNFAIINNNKFHRDHSMAT